MSDTVVPQSVSLVENEPFVDTRSAKRESVTLSASTVDSTNSPTTQLRRGLVVGYDAGTGYWIDAGDATVDADVQSYIDSAEAPYSGWQSTTLIITVPGEGTITHTWSGSLANLSDAIADILNNPAGSLVTGSNNGSGLLRLTANKPGVRLSLTPSLATAYAAGANTENTNDTGALTNFGILEDPIPSTLDNGGTAVAKRATIITRNAVVRRSKLLGLTTQALNYFLANNITFALES